MNNPLTRQSDGQIIGRTEIIGADSPSVDAFGRLRVTEAVGIFKSKQLHLLDTTSWEQETSGGGAIALATNEPIVELSVGTVSGDQALNQTVRYFPYVPGKSNLIKATMIFNEGKENLLQQVMYGDDNNGIGLQIDGTTTSFFIRSSTSGSPVNNDVVQADWNLDKLDGTGSSRATLDLTKNQILVMDFQYLSAGRVRIGFDIAGVIIYAHEFLHANVIDTTFMATPTLPVRYNIENTGTTASVSTLKQICVSIESESGQEVIGSELTTPQLWANARTFTAKTPLIAIRLKDTLGGKPNRRTARLLSAHAYGEDEAVLFQVAHMHAPSAITATWNSMGAGSGVEWSHNISAITGNPEHLITGSFLSATPGVGGPDAIPLPISNNINEHSFISQNKASNNSQVFVVFGQADGSAARALVGMTFLEFE